MPPSRELPGKTNMSMAHARRRAALTFGPASFAALVLRASDPLGAHHFTQERIPVELTIAARRERWQAVDPF
jgi:hypothetical protein